MITCLTFLGIMGHGLIGIIMETFLIIFLCLVILHLRTDMLVPNWIFFLDVSMNKEAMDKKLEATTKTF
jgi:hypothetical protein